MLFDPMAVSTEDTDAVGEPRFVSIGRGNGGRLMVVVHAEQNGEPRLISARLPTGKERKSYEG